MIKKLVLVFIAVFAIQSYAQEGSASPYSFYGIGNLKFKGTVENQSMGGLSIYSDSTHVNLRNPASYGGENLALYNNEGRPVKFSVGGSHSSTKLSSESGSDRISSTTFDYIALSIPLGKLGIGVGLIPYTAVGYKLETLNSDGSLNERFKGEGGTNRTYLAAGYQINNNFSVGVDVNYNFGNIKNNTVAYVYNNDGDLAQYQSRENNRSDLSGFTVNLGMTYKAILSDKLELTSAFTFKPESKLNSRNERSFNTITINSSGQEFIVNTIESDLESQGLKETKLTLPSKLSFGAGIGKTRKWFVGIETVFEETSKFSNKLYTASTVATKFENSTMVSLGGFYIPDYNSFTYLKRVVYRAGMRYGNTGLNINDQSIKEFGISFGVGIPVGGLRTFSNANFGVEFGNRGTTKNNLIKDRKSVV